MSRLHLPSRLGAVGNVWKGLGAEAGPQGAPRGGGPERHLQNEWRRVSGRRLGKALWVRGQHAPER